VFRETSCFDAAQVPATKSFQGLAFSLFTGFSLFSHTHTHTCARADARACRGNRRRREAGKEEQEERIWESSTDLTWLGCKGLTLAKPEMVPFRLTQNLIDGFGITGVEGVFRKTCEISLQVRAPISAFLRIRQAKWYG
jgi:hypothetical protein